jgi:hypothetical protein
MTIPAAYFVAAVVAAVSADSLGYYSSHYWMSGSASKLLGDRVARRAIAKRVAPYVEPSPSEKAPGESQGESLLRELLGK